MFASVPTNCAVDARQPYALGDGGAWLGWDAVDIEFSGAMSDVTTAHFSVTQRGGHGTPPVVATISQFDSHTVRVALAEPVEPDAWTCVHHTGSGTKTCVGYLPGDVNGDRTVGPVDLGTLIDCLNGAASCDLRQCDVNRSGFCDSQDILREIDLLNGGPGRLSRGSTPRCRNAREFGRRDVGGVVGFRAGEVAGTGCPCQRRGPK